MSIIFVASNQHQRLFNFVFVAIAGTYMALLAGIIAYIFLLALVSVVFLSRKND